MRASTSVLVALLLAAPAHGLDISSCGLVVPAGQVGVLQTDLGCTGGGVGVELAEGATLDMNGHAITRDGDPGAIAVLCSGDRCRIEGPGVIDGGGFAGIDGLGTGPVVVADIDIRDFRFCLQVPSESRSRLRASHVRVNGCEEYGIVAGSMRLTDVSASSNPGDGIAADNVRARNVEASNNSESGIERHGSWDGTSSWTTTRRWESSPTRSRCTTRKCCGTASPPGWTSRATGGRA